MSFKAIKKRLGKRLVRAAKAARAAKITDQNSQSSSGTNPSTSSVELMPSSSPDPSDVVERVTTPSTVLPAGTNSDNFSFANFNWIGYNDAKNSREDDVANLSASSGSDVPRKDPSLQYMWYPMSIKLDDGSETIAFKMTKGKANQLTQLLNSHDSTDEKTVEGILLRDADEVITTPSSQDRMRGVKPNVVVVRTPSSLIDLMDDQVPDLREGFFTEPQRDAELRPFAGGLLDSLGFNLVSSICNALEREIGESPEPSVIWNAIKRVIMNGNISIVPRLIYRITKGDLSAYIKAHPDENVVTNVVNWIGEWFWDTERAKSGYWNKDNPSDNVSVRDYANTMDDIRNGGSASPTDEWRCSSFDHLSSPTDEGNQQNSERSDSSFINGIDHDLAYVPLSFWRRLYAMGSCFSKRDAVPKFSRLMLTGSPSADLLLNRIPEIYIKPDGEITGNYWMYASVPLQGGLFKKIKNAVKKVGSAVAKVGKAVAKGVSKVMDSPLGAVISAVPVVGNIASVAGKVAGVVNKVSDKINNFSNGDDPEDKEVLAEGDDGINASDPQVARGRQSDILLKKDQDGKIAIDALPIWEAPEYIPYVAPPLSLLTGNPAHANQYIVLLESGSVPSLLEYQLAEADRLMHDLYSIDEALDARGPQVVRVILDKRPVMAGSPLRIPLGADAVRTFRHYWAPTSHGRYVGTDFTFSGDPGDDARLLAEIFRQFQPMSEWTNRPSLMSDNSQDNPFAATFFKICVDKGTSTMMGGLSGRPNEKALSDYTFAEPFMKDMKSRGLNPQEYLISAVIWAMILVTTDLSESKRREILESMKKAAITGLWQGRGLDQLVNLVLDDRWPSGEEILQKQIAISWMRMIAGTILFLWFDPSGNSDPFCEALKSVSRPSANAVGAMLRSVGDSGERSSQSPGARNEELSYEANKAASLAGSHAQGPAKALDALLRNTAAGLTEDEYSNALIQGSLADSGTIRSDDKAARIDAPCDSQFSSDMWDLARNICRRYANERDAAMRLKVAGVPPLLASLALQRYFPCTDPTSGPTSVIPFTRNDFMSYARLRKSEDGSDWRAL